MEKIKIPEGIKKNIGDFIQKLKEILQDELISVILYGSAASGEFIDKHSNLNLLVVLKNTDMEILKKSSYLVNSIKFRRITPLFLTQAHINNSLDVFPIEFLDMKENYALLFGSDVLKEITIDTRNLRFQCEQELKAKLIFLKQQYLRINRDKNSLKNLLFKSINSVLHILRNVLRLKAKLPPYLKEDILKEVTLEFQLDKDIWEKILVAKHKQIKLSRSDCETLFINFVRDLEKIVEAVDKL